MIPVASSRQTMGENMIQYLAKRSSARPWKSVRSIIPRQQREYREQTMLNWPSVFGERQKSFFLELMRHPVWVFTLLLPLLQIFPGLKERMSEMDVWKTTPGTSHRVLINPVC